MKYSFVTSNRHADTGMTVFLGLFDVYQVVNQSLRLLNRMKPGKFGVESPGSASTEIAT
jgi:hypothetical protein